MLKYIVLSLSIMAISTNVSAQVNTIGRTGNWELIADNTECLAGSGFGDNIVYLSGSKRTPILQLRFATKFTTKDSSIHEVLVHFRDASSKSSDVKPYKFIAYADPEGSTYITQLDQYLIDKIKNNEFLFVTDIKTFQIALRISGATSAFTMLQNCIETRPR